MASKIFGCPDPFGPVIPVKSVDGPITCPRESLLTSPLTNSNISTLIDTSSGSKSSLAYFDTVWLQAKSDMLEICLTDQGVLSSSKTRILKAKTMSLCDNESGQD